MSHSVLLYGFMIFFSCLLLHVVIWRVKIPWVSSLVLLVMFVAAPTAIIFAVMAGFGGLERYTSLNRTELLEILLLHLALSCAYIASYPAVRAVSPSLDILLMIASSGDGRMTEADLKTGYMHKRLVTARVDDLKTYRLIRENAGRFELSTSAEFIVRVFMLYRKLLGLPAGGG